MGDRQDWSYLEAEIRGHARSLAVFKMRSDGMSLVLSFSQISDFLKCVRAAASVNVFTEIGWLFEPNFDKKLGIDSCFLRLRFEGESAQSSIELFLMELGSGVRSNEIWSG